MGIIRLKFITFRISGKHAANTLMEPPEVISVHTKSRGMFPLAMVHANYYVKSRLALVGDSAHRIHPMAGQGVNLGFGDVKGLVECIEKSRDAGEDFGNSKTNKKLLTHMACNTKLISSVEINAIVEHLHSFSTKLIDEIGLE